MTISFGILLFLTTILSVTFSVFQEEQIFHNLGKKQARDIVVPLEGESTTKQFSTIFEAARRNDVILAKYMFNEETQGYAVCLEELEKLAKSNKEVADFTQKIVNREMDERTFYYQSVYSNKNIGNYYLWNRAQLMTEIEAGDFYRIGFDKDADYTQFMSEVEELFDSEKFLDDIAIEENKLGLLLKVLIIGLSLLFLFYQFYTIKRNSHFLGSLGLLGLGDGRITFELLKRPLQITGIFSLIIILSKYFFFPKASWLFLATLVLIPWLLVTLTGLSYYAIVSNLLKRGRIVDLLKDHLFSKLELTVLNVMKVLLVSGFMIFFYFQMTKLNQIIEVKRDFQTVTSKDDYLFLAGFYGGGNYLDSEGFSQIVNWYKEESKINKKLFFADFHVNALMLDQSNNNFGIVDLNYLEKEKIAISNQFGEEINHQQFAPIDFLLFPYGTTQSQIEKFKEVFGSFGEYRLDDEHSPLPIYYYSKKQLNTYSLVLPTSITNYYFYENETPESILAVPLVVTNAFSEELMTNFSSSAFKVMVEKNKSLEETYNRVLLPSLQKAQLTQLLPASSLASIDFLLKDLSEKFYKKLKLNITITFLILGAYLSASFMQIEQYSKINQRKLFVQRFLGQGPVDILKELLLVNFGLVLLGTMFSLIVVYLTHGNILILRIGGVLLTFICIDLLYFLVITQKIMARRLTITLKGGELL